MTRAASIDRIAFHGLRWLVARGSRPLVILVALVGPTGCRGLLGIEEPFLVDARPADAAPLVDAPGCAAKSERFDPCVLGPPAPALHLTAGSYTFDTTPSPAVLRNAGLGTPMATTSLTRDQPGQPPAVILYVGALTIDTGATLRVIGARPAIIAGDGTISISGTIDASSHIAVTDMNTHASGNVQLGAGANQVCTAASGRSGSPAPPSAGSGGGGGGSFYGMGGVGGSGDNNNAPGGAAGGTVGAPSTVRGGCAGGSSGAAGAAAVAPASQATVSVGGAGGGGIHLWSNKAIAISGDVLATGAGGAGSMQGAGCGGGGGGSGGYIGLEAPSVTISGDLSANGGGGGGGGAISSFSGNGSDGRAGSDPAAGGGASSMCGSAGASGGAVGLSGGSVVGTDPCGGGGAGGGAGYILIWSSSFSAMGATMSPAPLRDLP